MQIGSPPPLDPLGQFMVQVTLNGMPVEALIDTKCVRTLIKKSKGPFTPKVLRLQCIYGDVWEYRTKVVTIGIGAQSFTCRVGGHSSA